MEAKIKAKAEYTKFRVLQDQSYDSVNIKNAHRWKI